jgi:hypothetical protein
MPLCAQTSAGAGIADQARLALHTHFKNPALTEASNLAVAECYIEGLAPDQLVALAQAQTRPEVEVIIAFAPVGAMMCELDARTLE